MWLQSEIGDQEQGGRLCGDRMSDRGRGELRLDHDLIESPFETESALWAR